MQFASTLHRRAGGHPRRHAREERASIAFVTSTVLGGVLRGWALRGAHQPGLRAGRRDGRPDLLAPRRVVDRERRHGVAAGSRRLCGVSSALPACSSDDSAGPPPKSGSAEARSSTTATATSPPGGDIAAVERRPVPAGKGVAQGSDEGASSDYTDVEHLLAGGAHLLGPGDRARRGARWFGAVRDPPPVPVPDGSVPLQRPRRGRAVQHVGWSRPRCGVGPGLGADPSRRRRVDRRDRGASSVEPLQTFDPERYAELDVPTNDVAWDIRATWRAAEGTGRGRPAR